MTDTTDSRRMSRSCAATVVCAALATFSLVSPSSKVSDAAAVADERQNSQSPREDGADVPQENFEPKNLAYSPIALQRDTPRKRDNVNQVRFSPDGKSLFVAAQRAGELGLLGRKPPTYWIERWDTSGWKNLGALKHVAPPTAPAGGSHSIIALPAGDAHNGPPYGRDGLVKLWQIAAVKTSDSERAELLCRWIFGDDFLAGLGEAIEQEVREKLELKSEMEWALLGAVDDHFPSEIFDDERSVFSIHLLLPSQQPQRSKTIILCTSDASDPVLKWTRSYGLVTQPTAILVSAESKADSKLPESREVTLTWNEDRWVKVESDAVERTIE